MSGILDMIARERQLLQEFQPWNGLKGRARLHEYAKVELELIAEFDKARSAVYSPSLVEVEGFVSRVGGRLFILRPCLSVNHGILCDASYVSYMPTDYEFVRVKGSRVFLKDRSRYASRDYLQVEDLERVRLSGTFLKPEISLKAAEGGLLEGYPDLPRQIKTNLLSSVVSSPGEQARVGGLTATLLPLDAGYSEWQYRLLEDLRKSIPRDLTSQYSLDVRIPRHGEFTIAPFPWSLHNASDSTWDQDHDPEVFSRVADGNIREMTLGFSASSKVPRSLDEVWMSRADLPMLIGKEVLERTKPMLFDLELAKFFITVHTNYPFMDPHVDDRLVRLIMPRLEKLRKEYDEEGFGGLINPDMDTGSPRSIISIARTIARSEGAERVMEEHVGQALMLFSDSRRDIFEAWSETGSDFGQGRLSYHKEVQKIGKTAVRIVTYLIAHPNSPKASIRVALPRDRQRFFDQAFGELIRRNLIYRPNTQEDAYSATGPSK